MSSCVQTIHICCSSPESHELPFCRPFRKTRCVASAPHPCGCVRFVSHSFRLAKAEVYFPASTRVERSFRLDRSRIRLICEIEVLGHWDRGTRTPQQFRSARFSPVFDDYLHAHRPQRIVTCSFVSSFTVTLAFTSSIVKLSPTDRFTSRMPEYTVDVQMYPYFNGLPSESLDDYIFEVEALAARCKDDEKKLIGPRLVRRRGGVPCALAW